MTLDEFYEAFALTAPKFNWKLITRDGKDIIRAFSRDGDEVEICPITSVYWDQTKKLIEVWGVRDAGDKLSLSYEDVSLLMCSADNDIITGVSIEDRDACRAKLLALTGLTQV